MAPSRAPGSKPETAVVINGATGLVGSSGVLLALAMGAGRIVALGRNQTVLDQIAALDTSRVVTVRQTEGQSAADDIAAAAGGADLVFDAVGHTDDPTTVLDALRSVRRGGTVVIVGGLTTDISVRYGWLMGRSVTLRGSLWFPRKAAAEMLVMIARGTLDLSSIEARTYRLVDINEAIAAAAARPGGLTHIAITP